MHHQGNVAQYACFGRNKDIGINFFMRVHLVLALSDSSKFTNQKVQPLETVSDNDSDINDSFSENEFINCWSDDK